MSSLSDWENTKENIIPLKTGRDPTKLASFAKSNQSNEELEKEKEKFETIISEYKGDDPIDNWLKFIKWVQQSYPGGNMKEQLIILLERCTRLFMSTERYKNDPRYLRIWITYADMCRDPIDIFAFLENQRIGFYLSLIYEARAIVHENKGDYEKADKAFKQGIERNAQPITRLQQKHQDFERRLMARLKHQQQNQIETGNGGNNEVNDENQSSSRVTRSVLGTISSTSISSERKSQQIKGAPLGASVLDKKRKIGNEQQQKGQFQIYSDDAGQGESEVLTDSKFFGSSRKQQMQQQGPGGALQQVKWDELEPELTKHKENTQISQKWTDAKVIQKKLKTGNPTTAGFQVYCDDEFKNDENNKHGNSENSSPDKLKLHTKQQTKLEQIQNNPLANFPKSSSSSSTTTTSSAPPSKSSSSSSSSSSAVKNERIGYNKSLFTIDHQQHEISFEEYRASIMKKKIDQQLKLEKERLEQEERKRIDEEQQQAKLKLEKEREEQEAKDKQKKEQLEKEQQYQKQQQKQYQQRQQQNYNPPSPTMTIHTKQALNDVMAMFSEPLEFEKKSNNFSKNNNNVNTTTNSSIPSSPNPFSPKVIEQQPSAQQKQQINSTSISTDIELKDSSFNEELVEEQENLDPNCNNTNTNPLLSSKITNRDILKKQLSTITELPLQESIHQQKQQEFITLDQDRDVIQTMERIDFYVKKEATKFDIFQENSSVLPPSNGNQFTKSTLADKIAGKNKQPLQQSTTAFTIFQDNDQPSQQQQQPLQQQPQQTDVGFSFFQEETIVQKSIFSNTNSGNSTPTFTMYEDDKQPTSNTTNGGISSLSLSTISSKSMVLMDFSNTSDSLDSNVNNVTGRQQITGNITSLIDPTAIIEVSLTPSDGIVNPYFAEHMYILEQHVSSTVQSIETFHNVGDDLAPIPEEFLDQFNMGQVYFVEGEDDQRVEIDLAITGIKIKFTKCIGRSTMDGSFTYKVERLLGVDQEDDDALMSGMMSGEDNILTCKVQEPQSIWEFYICDQIQTRLQKQQHLSYSSNKFPMKQSLYYYTDKSILLMEHLDEGTLIDVIECSMQMDEPLAMFHCIELLRMVGNLHAINIIHGNICPMNLLYVFGETLNWPDWSIDGYRVGGGWKSKSFCLSDFSKSIDTTIYGNGSRFQTCTEHLPFGTPLEWISKHDTWTYNIDYLGIAKVIFYILTSGKEELKLSINQTTTDDDTNNNNTTATTLYITNINSIRKDFENSTLWINLLNSLLNHDGKIVGDDDSPLKLHREIFENYLHSNPMKSKTLKSTIRRQNHKLFELIKSK